MSPAETVISETEIRDWLLDLRAEGRSPHTLASYAQGARAYLRSSGGTVSRPAVRQFMAEQDAAGLAPVTQRQRLTAIRVLFRWLCAEGLADADPAASLRLPKIQPAPVAVLPRGDYARLLAAAAGRPRDRALISMLASTGMRVSELAGIRLSDLDLGRQEVLVLGKGSKWRVVPFSDACARDVARYLRAVRRKSPWAGEPALWLGQRGPLTAPAIDQAVRAAARRAGVAGVHCHRFRHTFANGWLEAGGSEQALMTICGWSSRAMLDRYSAGGMAARATSEYRRVWR